MILTLSLGVDSPNLYTCFWPILTQPLEFNSPTLRAKLQHNPSSKLLLSLLFGIALYTHVAIQLLDRQAPCTNLHFPIGCYTAWEKRPTLIIFFTAQLAFVKFMAGQTAAHSFLILMMPFMTWWQTACSLSIKLCPQIYSHCTDCNLALSHLSEGRTPEHTHTHMQNQTQKPQTWSLLIRQNNFRPSTSTRKRSHCNFRPTRGNCFPPTLTPCIVRAVSAYYVDELHCDALQFIHIICTCSTCDFSRAKNIVAKCWEH